MGEFSKSFYKICPSFGNSKKCSDLTNFIFLKKEVKYLVD